MRLLLPPLLLACADPSAPPTSTSSSSTSTTTTAPEPNVYVDDFGGTPLVGPHPAIPVIDHGETAPIELEGRVDPGRYDAGDVQFSGNVEVTGDLELWATGHVTLDHHLEVSGNVLVIAGAGITLGALVQAGGTITLIDVSEVGIGTDGVTNLSSRYDGQERSGSLRIATRGPLDMDFVSLVMDGYAPDDVLEVVAGQRLTLTGDHNMVRVQNRGALHVRARGLLSWLPDAGTWVSGPVVVASGADAQLSRMTASALSIRSGGVLTVASSACAGGTTCDVALEGAQVHVAGGGIDAGYATVADAAHGDVTVAADGRVSLEGDVHGGTGVCRGGSVVVVAGGRVDVSGAVVRGGNLSARDPSALCGRSFSAGDVSLQAHSIVRLLGGAEALPGEAGNPDRGEGTVTLTSQAPLPDPLPDPLVGLTEITSLALVAPGTGPVVDVAIEQVPLGDRAARVEISPDGSDTGFMAIDDVVGHTLQDGWRHRALVPHGLLESAQLVSITLWVAP